MRRLCTTFIVVMFLMPMMISAQTAVSTKGRDFWFTFMKNDPSSPPPQMNIFITADSATTASVFVGTTLVQNVTIPAGGSQRVDLTGGAAIQAYQVSSNLVLSNRAVHVVSQKDVTVYAFNTLQFSTDACIIYPTPVLGDEYVTACTAENTPNQRRSQAAIVGVLNGTIVEITPRSAVLGSPVRPAGVPYTITLNQGDVYQFQSATGDLTGTRIRVLTQNGPCNPIAVFSGHQRTILPLPGGSGGHDHLIEQIPPTRSLGQNFVVMPIQSANPSGLMMIRIIASEPNTQITFNGTPHTLTNIGDFREERPNINLAAVITANKPVLVAQYAMSANSSFSNIGDPFMAIVPPVEQFIDKFTYNAFVPQVPGQTPAQTTLWTNNLYLNILANTADIGTITVGGVSIASMGTNPLVAPARLKLQNVGSTGLSFATVRVAPGVYVVDASAGQGCSGFAYGLAQVDSYGFTGGARITNLRASIKVMDAPACPGRPVAIEGFSRDSNVITQWLWSFPHGASTFNTKRITKSFPAPGTYQAVLVLVKNGCALDTIVEDIVITTPITTQLTATPQPACEGATVVVTASASGSVAPYTYSWSAIDANGIVGSTTDSTATIRHDASGTFRYRVTVTDALGCIGVHDTSLVFLDGPEIQLADTVVMCRGDRSTIFATVLTNNSVTYQWTAVDPSDDSMIVGSRTRDSLVVRGDVAGNHTYRLRVVDANGCSDEDDVVVYVSDIPNIVNNGSDPVVRCLETDIPPITIGDSLVISGGTPPYTFAWTVVSGDGTSITGPTNQQITTVRPLFTTVYRLTVRGSDPRITCESTIDIVVQVRLVPDANAGEDRIICVCNNVNGVSIGENALCGRAPYTYTWTPATGLSNPTSTATGVTQADPQQTTTYVLTVQDADGGVNSDTVTVFVEPCPDVKIRDLAAVCEGTYTTQLLIDVAAVDPTTSTSRWTPTIGLNDPLVRSPIVTVDDSTYTRDYIVEVTSARGCIGRDTVTLRRSFGLRVIASSSSECATDTICRGDTVFFTATSTGGSAPYTYTWQATPADPSIVPGANGSAFARPLVPTTYVVTSTDAFGCQAADTVVVCVDPVPNAFAGADTIICASDAGVVPILRGQESTCGQAPFIYAWSPADQLTIPDVTKPWQADLRPTQTTNYILRVTDINGQGASTEDTITVVVRDPITIAFSPDIVDLCRGASDEALIATASGGEGTYVYRWFINGTLVQTTPSVATSELPSTFLASLTGNARITVTATDTIGCDGTDSIDIVVREAPTLTMTASFTICPCDSVQIGALAQGGTPFSDGTYRYRWEESIEEIEDGRSSISNDTAAITYVSPRTTTTYRVVAIDSAGCTSTPFFVTVSVDRPGIGTQLRPATLTADPRSEKVDIPIDVVEGVEQFSCLPDRLEFTLTYLEQLFDPFPTTSNGTIIENVVRPIPNTSMNSRSIRVRISPAPNLTNGSRITTVSGKALLGEPGETILTLSDITMIWDCDSIGLAPGEGSLTLDSLCVTDSVARLLGISSGQIRNVYPNPTSGSVTITLERRVSVASVLSIINTAGVEVYQDHLDAPSPGSAPEAQVPLELDLPNGTYRVVWRTPSTVSVHSFTIIR